MTILDFNARAELYLGSDHASAQAEGARHFRTAANALRFALEEAAPISLRGASLVVGNLTLSPTQMGTIYNARNYPLVRKTSQFGSRKSHDSGPASKRHQARMQRTASLGTAFPQFRVGTPVNG
jgi:hypothetical protein